MFKIYAMKLAFIGYSYIQEFVNYPTSCNSEYLCVRLQLKIFFLNYFEPNGEDQERKKIKSLIEHFFEHETRAEVDRDRINGKWS